MKTLTWRCLLWGTMFLVGSSTITSQGSTIMKADLGQIGPDVEFDGIQFSTVLEAGVTAGDQKTAITFHDFVKTALPELNDIVWPQQASFELSGVLADGLPNVSNLGSSTLISQPTNGGTFTIYDQSGIVMLSGTLKSGSLFGTSGPSATGGFLTAQLGTFTGPSTAPLDKIYKLLDPNSASISINMTDVYSASVNSAGFAVDGNGKLAGFVADAGASIGAEAAAAAPEPTGFLLVSYAVLGLLGFRRPRS